MPKHAVGLAQKFGTQTGSRSLDSLPVYESWTQCSSVCKHTHTQIHTTISSMRMFTPCSSSICKSVHLEVCAFTLSTAQALTSSWIAFVYLLWRLLWTYIVLCAACVCFETWGFSGKDRWAKHLQPLLEEHIFWRASSLNVPKFKIYIRQVVCSVMFVTSEG